MCFKRALWCSFLLVSPTFAGFSDSGAVLSLRETYTNSSLYDNISYLTAHNAFTIESEHWMNSQQSLNFDEQFAYGVWSFMLDLHWCFSKAQNSYYLALAHQPGKSNALNYSDPINHAFLDCSTSYAQRYFKEHRSFESFLSNHLKRWLDEDREAIITLHLESYSGEDGARQLRNLFQRTGIYNYIFHKPSGVSWPTLGQMRDNNTRLVIFSSNRFDSVLGDILHTTDYRETLYNLGESDGCERRFDDRDATNVTTILVLNHFFPSAIKAHTFGFQQINNPHANSIASKYSTKGKRDLATRTKLCVLQEGVYPTFIAVDHVEEGDAGGVRDWVLYLNQRRQNLSLSQPYFNTNRPIIATPIALSSPKEFYLLGLAPAISTLFAAGSYRYPWMAQVAAVTGMPTVFSVLEKFVGHYIPAAFASYLGAFQLAAFYPFLLRYHPLYAMVWLGENWVRPAAYARISKKKRR